MAISRSATLNGAHFNKPPINRIWATWQEHLNCVLFLSDVLFSLFSALLRSRCKSLTLSFSDPRSRKLSLLLPQSVLRRWFFAVFAFLHDRYTMLWQVRRLAVCLTISATHWQTRCVRTQIHSSQEIHSMLKH